MSGTPEGAAKARAKILARDPDFYKKAGQAGAKAYAAKPKSERKPRGFELMTPEERAEIGRRGGSKSRKGSNG